MVIENCERRCRLDSALSVKLPFEHAKLVKTVAQNEVRPIPLPVVVADHLLNFNCRRV